MFTAMLLNSTSLCPHFSALVLRNVSRLLKVRVHFFLHTSTPSGDHQELHLLLVLQIISFVLLPNRFRL